MLAAARGIVFHGNSDGLLGARSVTNANSNRHAIGRPNHIARWNQRFHGQCKQYDHGSKTKPLSEKGTNISHGGARNYSLEKCHLLFDRPRFSKSWHFGTDAIKSSEISSSVLGARRCLFSSWVYSLHVIRFFNQSDL